MERSLLASARVLSGLGCPPIRLPPRRCSAAGGTLAVVVSTLLPVEHDVRVVLGRLLPFLTSCCYHCSV